MEPYYIGVDVGTASVRAGLVSSNGRLVKHCSKSLQIWQTEKDCYEQSTTDVWENLCEAVMTITAGIKDKRIIYGLGFDATCSLVAVGQNGAGVTVSVSEDKNRDIIMWLDHRAVDKAERINQINHEVLRYVGGVLSPEMQAAKLLWLKENLPSVCWNKASLFLDLPEYLTYKATGDSQRSLCSLVCKFNYMGHESQRSEGTKSGWVNSYWKQIGLEDLVNDNYSKLGQLTAQPGCPLGEGLSAQAAEQMELWEGLPVGCSLIDAHAGGLGVIGADVKGTGLPCENQPITSRLAVICGTSTCHMAVSFVYFRGKHKAKNSYIICSAVGQTKSGRCTLLVSEDPVFVRGVWGPYFSAMVPGLWLNEGGQSATGKLIDYVIESHPSYKELKNQSDKRGTTVYDELNQLAASLAKQKGLSSLSPQTSALLARDLHMLPDFHGNRSPVADATLKICGLTLSSDLHDLTMLYIATLQALAHGTRHIVDNMNSSGHHINTMFLCGGLTKNMLYVQSHADVTGMPCVLPREEESVLVGSAILGACAAGEFGTVQDAMRNMTAVGKVVQPCSEVQRFHEKKHKVFLKMLNDQQEYRQMMEDETT